MGRNLARGVVPMLWCMKYEWYVSAVFYVSYSLMLIWVLLMSAEDELGYRAFACRNTFLYICKFRFGIFSLDGRLVAFDSGGWRALKETEPQNHGYWQYWQMDCAYDFFSLICAAFLAVHNFQESVWKQKRMSVEKQSHCAFQWVPIQFYSVQKDSISSTVAISSPSNE